MGWLSRSVFPTPGDVLTALVSLTSSGELFTHVAVSFRRAALGFLIGGGLGFALGVLNGVSRQSFAALDTSLQMVRNVPHLALIPLVILWFGVGESGKVFLVAAGSLFPIYLNTLHGVRNVDPALIEMGTIYGLTKRDIFRQIILPAALPSILVGVRYALGIVWMTLIVAETIAATSGIGYMAMNAREFLRTDVVVLSILLYAGLGKLADGAARWMEKRWTSWSPSASEAFGLSMAKR
jgi:sulfonate transport system permease protein